jgi:hypothetical protein
MVKKGDATMSNGLRTGLLRLINGTENLAGIVLRPGSTVNQVDTETLSEHDLRDLGMRDGRVSPSMLQRTARPDAWDIIDKPPRWL